MNERPDRDQYYWLSVAIIIACSLTLLILITLALTASEV